MNDDHPEGELETLRAEHRRLDERIRAIAEVGTGDQLELARMKKRKLRLKDMIREIEDLGIPDIIA